MRSDRLAELDGVRALMAWWVVAGHLAIFFSDRAGRLIHNDSAVLVFMALSGFVITSLICEKQETYGAYLVRRILRLWPAYLVALAVSAAILPLEAPATTNAPFHPQFATFRLETIAASRDQFWPQLASHLLMAHGLVPDSVLHRGAFALLGQAWSLSVEVQFYLLAPVIVALISLGRVGVAVAAGIGGALFCFGAFGPLADNVAFIGDYAPWFAVGVASYYLWRDREHRASAALTGALAVGLAGYTVLAKEPAALVWIGVILALHQRDVLGRLLRTPFLVHLGEASYSTYLFHMAPLFVGAWVLNHVRLEPWAYVIALSVVTLGATLAISLASHRFIEKPAMRLGLRLARTRTGAAGAPLPGPVAAMD
jgi:peptidoglycan/LPS O-acetylase OafA/YrhL